MHRRRWILWIPVTLWAGLIFYESSQPVGPRPSWWFNHADKVIHAVLFGTLALLTYLPLRKAHAWRPRHAAIIAFIAAVAYGVSDEFHQLATPTRSSDPWDAVADAAGASSVFIVAACSRYRAP